MLLFTPSEFIIISTTYSYVSDKRENEKEKKKVWALILLLKHEHGTDYKFNYVVLCLTSKIIILGQ